MQFREKGSQLKEEVKKSPSQNFDLIEDYQHRLFNETLEQYEGDKLIEYNQDIIPPGKMSMSYLKNSVSNKI